MAIRLTAAISLRNLKIIIIGFSLLYLKASAQQCVTGNGIKPDGSQSKMSYNQANPGQNYNAQHANMHQMNYQQPSNIQQASFMQQSGVQPQWNLQQASPPTNSISNSQASQNQNFATNTYSSQNIRQSQGTNVPQSNVAQQVSSHPITTTFIPMPSQSNKVQYGNQVAEALQFQPTYTLVSSQSNNPPQNQVNVQNVDYNQNQHSNSVINERASTVQNPIGVLVPSSQSNTPQSQPIILALQSPQMLPIQSPPTLPSSQYGVSPPIVYAVQTPSSASNQNQQIVPKQANRSNNRADDQSLMTYMMSQFQNQMGSDNALASLLPSIINTKSDKSSLKALLPLLFNVLNERNNGCMCPHCGCNSNNSNQRVQEPVINSGYSNKKVYNSQDLATEDILVKEIGDNDINSTADLIRDKFSNNKDVVNDNTEVSEEEDDEEEDSEESYEDE